MTNLNANKLVKQFPELKNYYLNSAVIFNGELRTVSDYEIPADLFAKVNEYVTK